MIYGLVILLLQVLPQVGTHSITPSEHCSKLRYLICFRTLTVDKASLIVTANDDAKLTNPIQQLFKVSVIPDLNTTVSTDPGVGGTLLNSIECCDQSCW